MYKIYNTNSIAYRELVMSEDKVSVLLVGINGYAAGYLNHMLDNGAEHGAYIVGIADPTAKISPRYDEVVTAGIPVYATMDEFYAEHSADLAIISTPIQLHCPHLQTALKNNSNVLCEKPLCATVDEISLMLDAAKNAPGKFVAIGFNWSFSTTIQQIKKDILSGLYGAPVRMKSVVFWPRNHAYYNRNNWAGKQKNANGDWILDSPLSNATSHFLHNMLYLCGKDVASADMPASVCAELYRANDIDNFDTAAVRLKTVSGVEINYYTTHAVEAHINPVGYYEFEKGSIANCGSVSGFTGMLNDGTTKSYELDPCINSHENKLWQCIEHCRGKGSPVCTLETATALTKVVNAAQLSRPQIVEFPKNMVRLSENGENKLTWVDGLAEAFLGCYDRALLPAETGLFSWAKPGNAINATTLETFSL